MKKKIQYIIQQITLKTVAVTCLFMGCLMVFAYIADENVLENENSLDLKVASFISAHATPFQVHLMQVITFFGSSQFLLPAYVVLSGYFLFRKRFTYAINIAVIAISSTGVMYLLKQLFKRHRPESPVVETVVGYGFPSGHSVSSFIFCGILAYLVWKSSAKKGIKYLIIFLLFLFSMAVGLSRIVLNVHFVTDVIAGFCFSIIWLGLSFYLMQRLSKTKSAT